MKRTANHGQWLLFLILLCASTSIAGVPSLINYEGFLADTAGAPVNGSPDITFSIYDAASGGASKWTEAHSSVEVQDGLFSVLLGSVNPLVDTVFLGESRWLGVKVGSDAEIDPRIQLVSMAYSHRVGTVDGASGGTIGDSLTVAGQVHITSGGVKFPDGTVQFTQAGASNG